uniref:Uncharacterized protein n=1 Tax=Solanum lycopersicum TaxID=4081 RepID=A0A494G8F5_SOLLC
MLAVVCKTNDGLKALQTYDMKGLMNKSCGLHGIESSIGRPLDHRYLVIYVENIRFKRRLVIRKPRYLHEETPPGFVGFAVNMINIDTLHVYKTKADMMQELPFKADGAISLDCGIIKGVGILTLGKR